MHFGFKTRYRFQAPQGEAVETGCGSDQAVEVPSRPSASGVSTRSCSSCSWSSCIPNTSAFSSGITYPTKPGSAAPLPRHVDCGPDDASSASGPWQMAGPKKRPAEVGGLTRTSQGRRCRESRAGSARVSGRRGARRWSMASAALVDGFLVAALHSPTRHRSSQARFIFLKDKWIYCSPISARTVAPILTPGGRARVARGENGARESR